jgi:hypothetical protein
MSMSEVLDVAQAQQSPPYPALHLQEDRGYLSGDRINPAD